MKGLLKLFNNFKKAHFTFLHYLLLLYIFFIPLWPKIPFKDIEYTYINIRYEDIFVTFVALVFVFYLFKKKFTIWDNPYLKWFIAYWIIVFGSFLVGHFSLKTVPIFNIGLLHSLRRVEYMGIFFIFYAAVQNSRQMKIYVQAIFLAMLGVGIYAMGQKFLGWPAYLTMNPVFSTGIPLLLKNESRIASTFGGHYDLGAFLVLLFPFVSARIVAGRKKYIWLFLLSLLTLVYTASRTSFIAYIVSTLAYLIWVRKWDFAVIIVIISVLMMMFTRDMTERFMKTFSVRQIIVNNKTGEVYVQQTMTKDELPAGSLYVPLKQAESKQAQEKAKKQFIVKKKQEIALKNKKKALKKSGFKNAKNIAEDSKNIDVDTKDLNVVTGVAYDISSATRFQVEWPRAFRAFKSNPLLGTGVSSITEASDNDFLRSLGETGVLGFAVLFGIIASIQWSFFKFADKLRIQAKLLYLGAVFGAGGLLINALYIDVFEASKVAFFIWAMWAVLYKSMRLGPDIVNSAFKDNK